MLKLQFRIVLSHWKPCSLFDSSKSLVPTRITPFLSQKSITIIHSKLPKSKHLYNAYTLQNWYQPRHLPNWHLCLVTFHSDKYKHHTHSCMHIFCVLCRKSQAQKNSKYIEFLYQIKYKIYYDKIDARWRQTSIPMLSHTPCGWMNSNALLSHMHIYLMQCEKFIK